MLPVGVAVLVTFSTAEPSDTHGVKEERVHGVVHGQLPLRQGDMAEGKLPQ